MKQTWVTQTGVRFRGVVGALLTAIAVAGCGAAQSGSQTSASGASTRSVNAPVAQRVTAAARRTLSLTASVEFRLDGARVFGPARAPVFGRGSFDFRAGEGQELIDLPEAAHQELGNERAIIFPDRVYLQPKGTRSSVLPPGKMWMSATVGGSESVSTNFPQFVGAVEGISPVLALSELALGTRSARALGEQLVDRAPAERYRVVVDLASALAGLAGAVAPPLGAAIQQQLTSAPSRRPAGERALVPFYVWVDRAGRVVEYQAELPGTGDGTALVQLRSLGRPVQVQSPSPSQVIDITALTPSGERENNGGGDSDGG